MKGTKTSRLGGPTSKPPQSQTNPSDRILVAEDDGFFRRLNTQVLLRMGYTVDAAADGAAAWQALNAERYDLLITDNSMPKLSGIELLKKLCGARMALPIIMATGAVPTEEFARYPWLQPNATLLKPYTGDEMLRTVRKVLREANRTAAGSQLVMHRDIKHDGISQSRELAGAPGPRPTSSSRRILVVDDDCDSRRLYAAALAGHGYQVDAAEDGAAAWAALKLNRYHLMITEHEIPNLTGVELIKMLRAARMAVPVVMAAGRLPTHELTRNPSLQLAATLSKPFAVDELMDTVKNVLLASNSPRGQAEPVRTSQSQPAGGGLWL